MMLAIQSVTTTNAIGSLPVSLIEVSLPNFFV
jgi:hypothetical protein